MKKKGWLGLFFFAAIFLGGCTTMRNPVASPSTGALEYRETQAKIQDRQTELAVTGVKIEEGSRDIADGLAAVETALSLPDYDREDLLNQVRDLRVVAEKHQADTETLNRQLAAGREATRRQGDLFDQHEEAWQKAVSERESENAALKIDNAKITGQRNLLRVISIALALVIIGYVIIRVLRFLRIIPV
jgi:hypothetical protein